MLANGSTAIDGWFSTRLESLGARSASSASSSSTRASPMSSSRSLGVFLEAPLKQPPNARGGRRRQGAPVRLPFHDRGKRIHECVARKRRATGQHLVQHAAKGPDVGALVDGLTARLLGAHVRRRADESLPGRSVPLTSSSGVARHPVSLRLPPTLLPGRSRALSPLPSRVNLMLAGFRSRWMMPFLCAASSASAICRAIVRASAIGSPDLSRASRAVSQFFRQRRALDELHHERLAIRSNSSRP